MLKRSQAISKLLTEKDAIRRDAKRIALHVCGGHFRYVRPGAPTPPAHQWQYNGDGKAIFELRRLWHRPEVTEKAIEAAWKMVAVHQVMGA